ncbi:MAG: FKBP-type peptidyl-prolyl cis-trans isomerase [Saprospiraceae bacterium]|nr:FKBP-type peptidyl-prolyl cis-trans isomerase [Saprospiraceae bacterium]
MLKKITLTHLLSTISLLLTLTLVSCNNDGITFDPAAQLEIDKAKLRAYLSEHNIQADSTSEGLFYIIDTQSDTSSTKPEVTSNIRVNYKGYLLNGKIFDSGNNVTFNLAQLITGWQIGLVRFDEGDTGRLFIPSGLAYGTEGSGSIPANTPLIFEITLIKVL